MTTVAFKSLLNPSRSSANLISHTDPCEMRSALFYLQWSPWRPGFESLCVGPWELHSDDWRLLSVLAVPGYCLPLGESFRTQTYCMSVVRHSLLPVRDFLHNAVDLRFILLLIMKSVVTSCGQMKSSQRVNELNSCDIRVSEQQSGFKSPRWQ